MFKFSPAFVILFLFLYFSPVLSFPFFILLHSSPFLFKIILLQSSSFHFYLIFLHSFSFYVFLMFIYSFSLYFFRIFLHSFCFYFYFMFIYSFSLYFFVFSSIPSFSIFILCLFIPFLYIFFVFSSILFLFLFYVYLFLFFILPTLQPLFKLNKGADQSPAYVSWAHHVSANFLYIFTAFDNVQNFFAVIQSRYIRKWQCDMALRLLFTSF